ncbi:hypothetical protein PUNSTDRAFT_126442 [Punctularia strigosozonata HHB-11173 SS5]|uniref:uncharacterized protein n=1 Tax=Punctularia strigosozonata (strain HHB-11173) TaxID=741275 RepID=UPI0004417F36|nr:uncharacterized protein PUNSTDRAFT_126442 [Punctularia strigosozonata HHB-11173 SS5]EIN08371.1 hypothetical protein PUNSTDRAFT_126442 [Punctularia strigosozonata HHB-11173 SS5]
MVPKLRVLAGPSPDEMEPITAYVNSGRAYPIRSDAFEGKLVVEIKGFVPEGAEAPSDDKDYFCRPDRKGVTWSIQVQGRFLQPHSADDILFGNTFDRPLQLPCYWFRGSGAALKFMKFVDPSLDHDLASSSKPWALSPLITTMPYFAHTRASSSGAPAFPSHKSVQDDTSELHHASSATSLPYNLAGSDKRRAYFRDTAHRREVQFGPQDVITTDFCYGFLEFSPTLSLRLPGGISFDLMKYWDGQPVRFVCCERNPQYQTKKGDSRWSTPSSSRRGSPTSSGRTTPDVEPWGSMFWCVAIELAEDRDEEDGERTARIDGRFPL